MTFQDFFDNDSCINITTTDYKLVERFVQENFPFGFEVVTENLNTTKLDDTNYAYIEICNHECKTNRDQFSICNCSQDCGKISKIVIKKSHKLARVIIRMEYNHYTVRHCYKTEEEAVLARMLQE